jgi:hypothetical protein
MPEGAKRKEKRKEYAKAVLFFFFGFVPKERGGGEDWIYGRESLFGRNDLTDSKPFEGEI